MKGANLNDLEQSVKNGAGQAELLEKIEKLRTLLSPTDTQVLSNIPTPVQIGERTFYIKECSFAIRDLVTRRVKKLMDLLNINLDKYSEKDEKGKFAYDTATMTKDIWLNLMKGFGTSKEVTDVFCEILYLLINGKPLTTEDFQSLNINPEKVKNRNEQISFEDIMLDYSGNQMMPILWKVLEMSDYINFFYILQTIAQQNDLDGILNA